ncbi:MAG: AAA family ATPase [Actinomycetota bacterium]|nr:AAA family ATPase [Actinomycetota bacterium]
MSRQRAVVAELAHEAATSAEDDLRCRAWLATGHQSRTYLRHLEPWSASAGFDASLPDVARHRAALEEHALRAEAQALRLDDGTSAPTRERLGVRLALIGKGGAGKTFVAATLARLLARSGRRVLAVDLDTNPGLSYSLGMSGADAALPREAVEPCAGGNYGWQLAAGLSPREVVDRFSAAGPDGVRLLSLAKIDTVDKQGPKQTVAALLHVVLGFGWPGWDVVADLEAGPTTPFERYHAFADDVAVVVGPAWRSALTARRLLPMVGDRRTVVVANRFRAEPDHPGLAAAVRLPDDPEVAQAERRGLAPLDVCPGSPAVVALRWLIGHLLAGTAAA